jgi:hypothetical protein
LACVEYCKRVRHDARHCFKFCLKFIQSDNNREQPTFIAIWTMTMQEEKQPKNDRVGTFDKFDIYRGYKDFLASFGHNSLSLGTMFEVLKEMVELKFYVIQ